MGRIRDAKLAKKARAGEAFGPETCADWRMGRCDRGERCRYAHGGRERICPSFPGAVPAASASAPEGSVSDGAGGADSAAAAAGGQEEGLSYLRGRRTFPPGGGGLARMRSRSRGR